MYLVPKEKWKTTSLTKTRLAVRLSAEEYLEVRRKSLALRLTWFSNNLGSLEGVNIEKAKLRLDRLEKDTPEEVRTFSLSLCQELSSLIF